MNGYHFRWLHLLPSSIPHSMHAEMLKCICSLHLGIEKCTRRARDIIIVLAKHELTDTS